MPKIVKAKMTRVVYEINIVKLDNDGNIEEILDTNEIDSSDEEIQEIIDLVNEW